MGCDSRGKRGEIPIYQVGSIRLWGEILDGSGRIVSWASPSLCGWERRGVTYGLRDLPQKQRAETSWFRPLLFPYEE